MTTMVADVDKRSDYERRARECVQALHGLMTEAKKEGYALEVYSSLGMDGQPQSKISAVLR